MTDRELFAQALVALEYHTPKCWAEKLKEKNNG